MTPEPVRFEQAALETILESLLADHPDAFVAAIDPEPIGRFVPIPSSLHLRGQAVLEARTALDLVVPADRGVVISDASALERLAQRVDVSPLPPRIGRVRKDALAVIVEVDAALLRILGS